MKALLCVSAMLALTLLLDNAVNSSVTMATEEASEDVLLSVDLTKGDAGDAAIEVKGGTWESGWRVQKLGGERIVWDLGREVPAGVLEIKFTVVEVGGKKPWDHRAKLNWAGAYQNKALQHRAGGSKVYVRTGEPKYGFSRLKASDRPFDHSETEATLGKTSTWILDDKTVHTIRMIWSPGKMRFEGPGGVEYETEEFKSFGSLRHVFIGCDKSYGISCPGIRYLSVQVMELKS